MLKLLKFVIASILFVISLIFDLFEFDAWVIFIPSIVGYILIGYEIYIETWKDIMQKQFFTEHTLIVIATIAAYVLVFIPPTYSVEFPEATAIALFYQIGEYLNERSIDRSKRSIEGLIKLQPTNIKVRHKDKWITRKINDVKVGETILVNPGDVIPLDGIITKGSTNINTATIDGESTPIRAIRDQAVLSGCANMLSPIEISVTQNIANSTLTKITNLMKKSLNSKSKAESFMEKFAKFYTPIALVIALLITIIPPLIISYSSIEVWQKWLNSGITVLIISCPCALVLCVPLAFFNGLGAASKYGILIKGGQYLEILGKLDTIGFDKTGTLTEGVFDINELHIVNNKYTKNEVIKIVASMEVNSNHPIALSIVNSYKRAVKEDMINNIQVITGSGIIGKYKDKRVIVGSHALLAKNNINSKSCDCDLTHVYIAIGNEFVGYLGLGDKIKPGAKELIKELKKLQIKNIIMLTGNIKKNAQLISNQLDIKKYFYELLPKDKLDIISEFEAQAQKGKYVCFCGDGVNDAPSLARADVGIAMGNIGSQVSVDAADCVITDDNLLKIISTIRIAKRTLFCSKLNIALSLGFKICILALSLISNILFIPMILDIGLWLAIFADVGVMLITITITTLLMNEKINRRKFGYHLNKV